MYKDEIITEVWKNRKAFVEQHNHDLDAMVNDLKLRQDRSKRKIVDRRLIPNDVIQPNSLDARH